MFDLIPLDGDERRVRITLDPRQPFLADHRVGRGALLSTVMSIEAMAQAAQTLSPGSVVRSVEQLTKRGPVLVGDGKPESVEVEVTNAVSGGLRCLVVSDPDGERRPHDEATLELAAGLGGPLPASAPVPREGGSAAEQDVIYGLFFHGPAFRVIGSARLLSHNSLVAELAVDLPPLVENGSASAVSPRLIELCLQAAGVLELASSGRMAVPRSIESIVRYSDIDCDPGTTLRAAVCARENGDGSAPAFDASLLDNSGEIHLEVRGYRTIPYDQPVDQAAVAAILAALGV